jgi:hypothetical protein
VERAIILADNAGPAAAAGHDRSEAMAIQEIGRFAKGQAVPNEHQLVAFLLFGSTWGYAKYLGSPPVSHRVVSSSVLPEPPLGPFGQCQGHIGEARATGGRMAIKV